ncbi:Pyridoxal biosynthesis lyase pdxS [Phytophthora palmivora]|uniref:pyridoxal 5'-phosphate synthase (glutamine hydrolyzing) n=1 Tax=Phytophthora palmivora TaxID=4796 RepID=A0A2P4Y6D3_9STRA|nr:Pyridoxal biosynthesis lyase pdxS [Phytophthora palmivora]
MDEDELFVAAKEMQAPYELVKQVATTGKLPVVNFAAGGVATPADAALMMQLGRVAEGAAMLRTKGEAGTGNVVEAVRHARSVQREIRRLASMDEDELFVAAKEMQAPYELVKQVATTGKLPVVNFAAGGVATPADAALMMQLGMDGVFVGSGIFKSGDPAKRARAMVQAVTHFNDPKILKEISTDLGEAMVGVQDLKAAAVNFRDREGELHGAW